MFSDLEKRFDDKFCEMSGISPRAYDEIKQFIKQEIERGIKEIVSPDKNGLYNIYKFDYIDILEERMRSYLNS